MVGLFIYLFCFISNLPHILSDLLFFKIVRVSPDVRVHCTKMYGWVELKRFPLWPAMATMSAAISSSTPTAIPSCVPSTSSSEPHPQNRKISVPPSFRQRNLKPTASSPSPFNRRSGGQEPEFSKEENEKKRKEEVNRKIASKKAISVILRREASMAVIEKKRGKTNSKRLLPRSVLEALHDRISALRWESALQVCTIFVQILDFFYNLSLLNESLNTEPKK